MGSQTSGANGGVTRTILPGGIVVNFTAQSVRNHDGTRLQRVGLRYLRPLVHPDGRAAVEAARHGPELETIELTVPFERIDYAYRELMTFGRDVEVLDPPELRERIRATAEELLALYR